MSIPASKPDPIKIESQSDGNSSSAGTDNSAGTGWTVSMRRVRLGLSLTLLGFVVFLVGARPALFNLDRSASVGFVQIAVFLVGLAFITIGGYLSLAALWEPGTKSILADIGLRMVSTGYVIAVFSGMADIFGFGSHPLPDVIHFGYLQQLGVGLGQLIIAVGFLLLIPYHKHRLNP
jgi:hypothetical protein